METGEVGAGENRQGGLISGGGKENRAECVGLMRGRAAAAGGGGSCVLSFRNGGDG